jgi:hypothetical protein
MKRINNFVKNTFKDVPKDKRDEIIASVSEKLIEKVEDLIESGYELDDAINKTVVEFGTMEDYLLDESKKLKKLKRKKTIAHYRNDLLFSVFGSLITIGILIFINLYFLQGTLWFVVPSIAILWWPLVLLYRLWNKKESKKGEKDE